jgi:L-lactate dehydrogenase complex protein LldG
MGMTSQAAREKILRRLKTVPAKSNIQAAPALPNNTASKKKTAIRSSLKLADQLLKNRFEVIDASEQTLGQVLSQIAETQPYHWLLGNGNFYNEINMHLQQLDDQTITTFDQPFEALKETIFDDVDIGVTLCAAIIKDTGTLVIQPSPEEPRTLSLIPPIHLIFAGSAPLFESLSEYFAQLSADSLSTHSNLIFVSSPSKTADIQQKLAYGAHGPKRVIIVFSSGLPDEID